jgi:hypothetical protein
MAAGGWRFFKGTPAVGFWQPANYHLQQYDFPINI